MAIPFDLLNKLNDAKLNLLSNLLESDCINHDEDICQVVYQIKTVNSLIKDKDSPLDLLGIIKKLEEKRGQLIYHLSDEKIFLPEIIVNMVREIRAINRTLITLENEAKGNH